MLKWYFSLVNPYLLFLPKSIAFLFQISGPNCGYDLHADYACQKEAHASLIYVYSPNCRSHIPIAVLRRPIYSLHPCPPQINWFCQGTKLGNYSTHACCLLNYTAVWIHIHILSIWQIKRSPFFPKTILTEL